MPYIRHCKYLICVSPEYGETAGGYFMSTTNTSNRPKLFNLTFAAILAAMIFVLTFTVGSIRLGPITITLNCLPVAIGSIILGPVYGAGLGLIFGLSSFMAAFSSNSFTTMLLEINVFYTFIMCVVPRVICGFVPGLVYRALPKKNEVTRYIGYEIASVLTPLLNTVGFLGFMWLFFSNTSKFAQTFDAKLTNNILLFIIGAAGINAIFEIIVNLVFAAAICKALSVVMKKTF